VARIGLRLVGADVRALAEVEDVGARVVSGGRGPGILRARG